MADWEDIGNWQDVAQEPTLKEKLIGAGETALTALTGGIGGGLGLASGTIAGLRQHGFKNPKAVEEEAARQAAELTYEPRTAAGKEYTEKYLNPLMQELIPVAPILAPLEGAMAAGRISKSLKKAGQKAEREIANLPKPPVEKGWEDIGTVPGSQGDLFANAEVSGPIATPYNAAERGAAPQQQARGGLSNRRQQELQLEQKPTLYAGKNSEISSIPTSPIAAEHPEVVAAAREAAEERTRQLNEVPPEPEQQPFYVNEKGQVERTFPTKLAPEEAGWMEVAKRAAEEKQAAAIEAQRRQQAAQAAREAAPQENLFPETPQEIAGVDQSPQLDLFKTAPEPSPIDVAVARVIEQHPLMKAAVQHLEEMKKNLEALKASNNDAKVIAQAEKDVAAAEKRVTTTKNNIDQGVRKGKAIGGLKGKKQGGAANLDFLTGGLASLLDKAKKKSVDLIPNEKAVEVLKNVPGVSSGLRDFNFERRSAEALTNDILSGPQYDIPKQGLTDRFQKGALYKQVETNNPIVRKTFAAFKDAHKAAQSALGTLIQNKQDGIAKLFRTLGKDAGPIWDYLRANEGKAEFTEAQLKDAGFSDAQAKFGAKLRDIENYVYGRVNETLESLGKKPIDKRLGHLAGSATGDFKRLIYKTGENGEKQIVGIIGSNFSKVTDARVKRILEQHPEWTAGEMQTGYRGKRRSVQKDFEDVLQLIAEDNPEMQKLLESYDQALRDESYNYMNAKKHTMAKKGIFGTQGFALEDQSHLLPHEKALGKLGLRDQSYVNAREGMEAQIKFYEKMINWAELSKAANEVKPLLTNDQIKMPNAKQWATDYMNNAMGINPSELGNALEGMFNAVGHAMGVGPSAIKGGIGTLKGITSKMLLGFVNPFFLTMQMMQPATASPAVLSLMKSRGIEGVSTAALAKGLATQVRILRDSGLSAFEKQIRDEGKNRNIFGGEIFDNAVHLTKKSQALDKIAQFGIPETENLTRGQTFSAIAHILKEDGRYTGKELFDIAENLTTVVMNDYSHMEAPKIYSDLGPIGQMMYTLQSFKHNSLSSMAMLAREAKRNGSVKPLATMIGTGVALSGLTGMLGFNEADQLYQWYTKMNGKPDTLTRLVMDSVPEYLSHGAISAATGVNMSKRFGMTLLPDSPGGALFPGVSRLGQAAGAAYDVATQPTNTEAWKRLAVKGVPNSLSGLAERQFFEDENGLAHSLKTGEGTVQRNAADKVAKTLGGVGLHESKLKERLYQEDTITKKYDDQRKAISARILDDITSMDEKKFAKYFKSGDGQKLVAKFIESEGSVDNLVNAIEQFKQNQNMTAMDRKMLAVSAANNEGDAKKAARYAAMQEKMGK